MRNLVILGALVFFVFTNFSFTSQRAISVGEQLSDTADELLFLLEEEKMARDVYLEMVEKYDVQIFKNISNAEQRHLDMMMNLAEKYNIEVPVSVIDDERGVFKNPEIQTLYNELIAMGEESLVGALKAGAKIEELDITDLENLIMKTTDEDDKVVYSRLLNASHNHLRAFVRNLENQGIDYAPIAMEKADFEKIIGADSSCASGKKGKKKGKACCSGKKKGKGKGGCKKS